MYILVLRESSVLLARLIQTNPSWLTRHQQAIFELYVILFRSKTEIQYIS